MERFLETIIDGIAVGSIYGALALALVLIYRSTGIVNFAQGEMAMFATFIAWALTEAGIPIGLAVLMTIAFALVAGMIIERVLIRPVEGGQELTLVVVTLGLFIFINGMATWIWGPQNRGFPRLLPNDRISVLGLDTTWEAVLLVVVLLAVAGILYLLFNRTKIGLAMRAAA